MLSCRKEEAVCRILTEKLQVQEQLLVKHNFNKPLTGSLFKLNYIQLVYLLLEVEKEFSIRIPEKNLLNYGFNSIDNIVSML